MNGNLEKKPEAEDSNFLVKKKRKEKKNREEKKTSDSMKNC